MIIHRNLEQRTDEWHEKKAWKVSSSKITPLLSGAKLGTGAKTYAIELIAEKAQTIFPEGYISYAMQEGINNEEAVREKYAEDRNCEVIEVGGVENDSHTAWFSPDGLIMNANIIEGFIEIKSPQPKQHMINLMNKELDKSYIPQIQFGFLMTGAKWCDFISYCPLLKEELQFKIVRILPDWGYITNMQNRINAFNILKNDLIKNSNTNLNLL